jgi:riboflavin kinase/FMN adenylyltransferase
MKTIFGLEERLPAFRFPIVTVGVFDGVHIGHRAIIAELLKWARRKHGMSIVITFEPHPEEVLYGTPSSFLSSLKHRLLLLERMGVDVTLVVTFDTRLASMKAEEFVENILVGRIGAKGVVIGFDNRFGRDGKGDINLLKRLGKEHGFQVRGVGAVRIGGRAVSSSRLRRLITGGRLKAAERMLGRPVSILGTVVAGDRRGKGLGFPTANLDPHHEVRPPAGIYVTRALRGDRELGKGAVTFIGRRLTFGNAPEEAIEVHILDYSGDLYGQDIEVQFLKKLRRHRRFSSPERLRKAIARDIERAEAFFRSNEPS